MLNEERIILMTQMASYEANEGKKNVAIGSYFRSDYIGWQVLKSIISATIAFIVVFAMYIFYDFEHVIYRDADSSILKQFLSPHLYHDRSLLYILRLLKYNTIQ